MQKPLNIMPKYLNLDAALEKLSPEESPFIKGVGFQINDNPDTNSNNPTGFGQDTADITPLASNAKAYTNIVAPKGTNSNYGYFYFEITKEGYYFNRNSNGLHGIYLLDASQGAWVKVIEDENLPFTQEQSGFLAPHRVSMRVLYDSDGNIAEKFLVYTNAQGWQGWINVIAAVSTNGFDASAFPYWRLLPPHFDRRELLEWAVRPPMYNPTIVPIANNTTTDVNKTNRLIDQAFQVKIGYNYTDGRPTTTSPDSLPLIIKEEDFLNSPDVLPKNALITMSAGSCMTESIDIFIRFTAKQQQGIPSVLTWGDWFKHIRLYKFTECSNDTTDIIGSQYWLRTNAWSKYNYDSVQNTIQYVFDNSILSDIVDQSDVERLQTALPQRSVALTDINDAALLANNRYNYDNLGCSTIDNLSVSVQEKTASSCAIKTRTIKLYAYIGRGGDDFDYFSQIGYFVGADTTVRFGSLGTDGVSVLATFSETESKYFDLDFADKKALRVYLKGTPYYADGVWTQVNSDNSIVPLPAPLDFSDTDNLQYVQNIFKAQGFFICAFTLEVPAGRYIATLGRHNVSSSGDYINTSTYIEGIANSRAKSTNHGITTIKPNTTTGGVNALVSSQKEMELDCTNADIDVWGNGADLFYVYCPYITHRGNGVYRFIEGYWLESVNSPIGVEYFPYHLVNTRPPYQANNPTDDSGKFTDKNGFYFAYTKVNDSDTADVQFICKLNCTYPHSFTLPTSKLGGGYCVNGTAYLSDHNNGVVGDCNRVLVPVKITSVDGTIPYSNIGVSIFGGATVYTGSDGTATLIVHNGNSLPRNSNIYVNAGGNFIITIADCGSIPLFVFNENNAPCFNCLPRTYPFGVILGVNIIGGTQFSLKENGAYSVGVACADLAGRLTFVNVVASLSVPSFLTRNNLNPTFFRLSINGSLKLPSDMAWFAPYVSPQLNVLKYIQWVGDSIQYINNAGVVVTTPESAVLVSISIQSLYNTNIANNFSLLSTYQFVPGDRIRILDDGNGNLLNTATNGQEINLQILGTNYTQAAMAAGLIPNTSTVPVINNNNTIDVTNSVSTGGATPSTTTSAQTVANNQNITLYVKFDSRLAKLINDTGFWIEIYTPQQQTKTIEYNELQWYPVIDGEVAVFAGYSPTSGQPVYTFPTFIDISYWDTYLFTRNIAIPNVGDKFLNHPFESPNISDSWGANVTSGGRQWEKNDDAVQQWIKDDAIVSDNFVGNGIINGLGTFREENRKSFTQYPYGGIIAMHTERSIIIFICENDWFTTTFDFHYTYPNQQGLMVVNLDDKLSQPNQKIGNNFGLAAEHTATFIVTEREVYWYDAKNEAFVGCDYKSASDVSDIVDEQGNKYGVKSWMVKKTQTINSFNQSAEAINEFIVVAGYDAVRKNIFLTFRNRNGDTNDPRSYVNNRRNIDLLFRETIVYDSTAKRWTRFTGFCPEGYGMIKGKATGVEFISFAAGIPYYHNNVGGGYLNYYGLQTEPVFMGVMNTPKDVVKILQSISVDVSMKLFIDLIYSDEDNSYSYIPANYFTLKENIYYTSCLRNMNSYPNPVPDLIFQSMLIDGKRNFGVYFVVRFVGAFETLNEYFQVNNIYSLMALSEPNKK